MKKFQLVLITENQNSKEKARKLAQLISETLKCKSMVEISQYDKFENSFRIEILGVIEKPESSIEESIKLTDRICSPWLMMYKDEVNEIELLFNKTQHSKFRKEAFNVLRWANFEILEA